MKVIDHLKNAEKTLSSVEILPPLKGKSIQSIWDILDPLMEFNPAFVDVTYHREEYVYKKREGGFLEVLTDEMTIIDQVDGIYYAFASPFWSEGRIFEIVLFNEGHIFVILRFNERHIFMEISFNER